MNTTPRNNHSPLNALAARVNGALAPKARFTTTPTTRNGDGFHRTSKPTGGEGQWMLVPGAKLPPRAFEVFERERERFHRLSLGLPLDGDPVAAVEVLGRNIFDATYGAEQHRFEAEIAAGQIEALRLAADHGRLEADLEHVPATVEVVSEQKMPDWFGLKWWKFVFFGLCFALSAAGAVSNIVSLVLPAIQVVWFAVAVAVVWVLLAIATKVGLRATRSPIRELLNWGIVAVGFCGAVVWLVGMVTGYATEINLNDLAAGDQLARSKVAPFVGQLLAEFAVGYACLCGMLNQIEQARRTIPNPDREVLSRHLAGLNEEAGGVQAELANPLGNLAELNASRECFVAEGVGIVRLRMEDAALLAEIQRRREENQRLLAQFTS